MTTAIAISNSINSVINNLADKLHVPAAKLFECLIAQAHIVASMSLLVAFLFLIPATIFLVLVVISILRGDYDADSIFGSSLGAAVFFGLAVAAFFIYMTAHYNPDYWALNHFMGMIHGATS